MISWGGISSCIIAYFLDFLARSYDSDADALDSVTRVSQLKELAKRLDVRRDGSPLVVAVTGKVGCDNPIICKQSGLRCVIVREEAVQDFRKYYENGTSVTSSVSKLVKSKEVPWYLDDGTQRVPIVGARSFDGLSLRIGSVIVDESVESIVRRALDHLNKDAKEGKVIKLLGAKRIEWVLPTGSALTVVGEAVKDDIGTVRIQCPRGGPFYVTHRDIDDMIDDYRGTASFLKYTSTCLAIFGILLITRQVVKCVEEKWRRWRLQRRYRILAAAAERSDRDNERTNRTAENEPDRANSRILCDAENESMEQPIAGQGPISDYCVICHDQQYNAVFLPCAHMCCCINCCVRLTSCPLCRRRIDDVVKTYRH